MIASHIDLYSLDFLDNKDSLNNIDDNDKYLMYRLFLKFYFSSGLEILMLSVKSLIEIKVITKKITESIFSMLKIKNIKFYNDLYDVYVYDVLIPFGLSNKISISALVKMIIEVTQSLYNIDSILNKLTLERVEDLKKYFLMSTILRAHKEHKNNNEYNDKSLLEESIKVKRYLESREDVLLSLRTMTIILAHIFTKNDMPIVVNKLKNNLTNKYVFNILFMCAKRLSYKEFYQAWHSPLI